MKVYLETLGCRLNESEIESMARQFAGKRGFAGSRKASHENNHCVESLADAALSWRRP